MPRHRRAKENQLRFRRLAPVLGAALLLAASIGSVSAANPNASFAVTVCIDSQLADPVVTATMTWSGIPADSFGWSSTSKASSGGLGAALDHVTAAGTLTIGFVVTKRTELPDSIGGFLGFKGGDVAGLVVQRPHQGWADCP